MHEEATAAAKSGDFKKALANYLKCVELDPLNATFNATMLVNASLAQDKLGNRKGELEALNLAIKYNPKFARAYIRRGDHWMS